MIVERQKIVAVVAILVAVAAICVCCTHSAETEIAAVRQNLADLRRPVKFPLLLDSEAGENFPETYCNPLEQTGERIYLGYLWQVDTTTTVKPARGYVYDPLGDIVTRARARHSLMPGDIILEYQIWYIPDDTTHDAGVHSEFMHYRPMPDGGSMVSFRIDSPLYSVNRQNRTTGHGDPYTGWLAMEVVDTANYHHRYVNRIIEAHRRMDSQSFTAVDSCHIGKVIVDRSYQYERGARHEKIAMRAEDISPMVKYINMFAAGAAPRAVNPNRQKDVFICYLEVSYDNIAMSPFEHIYIYDKGIMLRGRYFPIPEEHRDGFLALFRKYIS